MRRPISRRRTIPTASAPGPEELLVMMHYQPILAEAVRKFPAQAWVDAAADAGMTIQAVRSPEEALCDPLFLADGCVVEIDDPELGPVRQVGTHVPAAREPRPRSGAPAPRSGEHTEEVRAEGRTRDACARRDRAGRARTRGGRSAAWRAARRAARRDHGPRPGARDRRTRTARRSCRISARTSSRSTRSTTPTGTRTTSPTWRTTASGASRSTSRIRAR